MLLIYNGLQIIIGCLLLPVLLPIVLLTPKYRGATWLRLGFGLRGLVRNVASGQPRIWIHALSVGEVSSARALVAQLRQKYPAGVLIFSASTRSGRKYAASVLAEQVDLLVPFPLDFFWSAEHFIRVLRPDLFLLIETDLWPNFLASLQRAGIPSLLLNGRFSQKSYQQYLRFKYLFAPLFRGFAYIAMQTEDDADKLKYLGVGDERVLRLGNLKYGVLDELGRADKERPMSAPELAGKILWVAGSTHPGEEEIILKVYRQQRQTYKELYLVIAPRNIERGREIAGIARGFGLESRLRSSGEGRSADLLILDTLGELASLYKSADFAFIGGSLVRARGHNPLEPALFAKPVIFGPHMEDFAEVARDLLGVGGAFRVNDEKTMAAVLDNWLNNDEERLAAGKRAAELVRGQGGVTGRYVDLVCRVLNMGKN